MNRRRQTQRGAAALELALVAIFFFTPLIFGTAVIGLNIIRSIQVTQLNRDACNMFARGVDFTIASNRQTLIYLAEGLNITDSGGDGVIILSVIEGAAGGQAVCTRRITVGNPGLRSSAFANPTALDAAGNVDIANDAGASANTFLALIPLDEGDVSFVAEAYFRSPDLDMPGFRTNTGVSARAVF